MFLTASLLALGLGASTAQASDGGTMYYLEFDGDPRTNKSYYINTIEMASDGTASFGIRVSLTGFPSDGNAAQSMTLMQDGSLVGTYGTNRYTQVFVIDAADVSAIGTSSSISVTMGGSISTTIEGAFTGCDGALYLGDSGTDNVGAGGAVIRIDQSTLYDSTLSYETVITTSATDIDGLGPGIVANEIVDSPGYAIDSGTLLTWDYLTGTVTSLGSPGVNYELHALGGDRFDDGQARLLGLHGHPFVALAAELRLIDPSGPSSTLLQTGDTVRVTGLTGPMDCTTSTITGETGGVTDTDGDGIDDEDDNCPDTANADQADLDEDGSGDSCDSDADGDGDDNSIDCDDMDPSRYSGAVEVCDDVIDNDCDGDVDLDDADVDLTASDSDCDGDGFSYIDDNCTDDFNPGQSDLDADTYGDVCDADDDGDGVADDSDNCPLDANSSQADTDGDGYGDACDDDVDDDGVLNADDACEDTIYDAPTKGLGQNRWADVDGDGEFDTKGKNPTGRYFTVEDTLGCSCEQIIETCGYGSGHSKHGCSNSVMDTWTGLYDVAGGTPGSCKVE